MNVLENPAIRRHTGAQGVAASPSKRTKQTHTGNIEATAGYTARWLSGKPTKRVTKQNAEEKLRAAFWAQEGALPRCFSCRKSNATLSDAGPTGNESLDLLPCGCEYKEALLEMWMVKKGVFTDVMNFPKARRPPMTLGKHRYHLLRLFEIVFGSFSVEKMLNIGNERVEACKEEATKESRRGGPLEPLEENSLPGSEFQHQSLKPGMKTNLDIVKDCDNFPHHEPGNTDAYDNQLASLYKFFLPDDTRPHGFMLESVVERMPWTEDFRVLPAPQKEVHLLRTDSQNWQEACNQSIDKLLDIAREKNVFPKLGQKRDEKFPIVGARFPISIERTAISLFGIIGRGVHMTAYTRSNADSSLKFWIPQRSPNKSTYPSKLDNAVAGGVAAGETPFECLVREASEEAGIAEDVIRKDARAGGTVTWFNVSDERAGGEPGLMNPGMLYVYDLEVGEDVRFEPVDEDICAFRLMDVQAVQDAMAEGLFKPASANVMMDFLIRHGLITAEDDEDYAEIFGRLHRKLPFATNPRVVGDK